MAEWHELPLGEVITLHRGFDLPSRLRIAGSIPVVSSSGVTGHHATAKVDPPGVVTGRYGTLGEVFYLDRPFWPLNTTLFVSEFNGNNPRFVAYFLESMNLATYNGAAAVPGLDRNALHRIKVRWPDRVTQAKVAAVLAGYDELIANNHRRIHITEEMVEATYSEWFRARSPADRGETNAHAVTRAWAESRVGELVDITRGRSYASANLVETGGRAFVNLKCIDRDGGFRRNGIKRYDGPFRDEHLVRAGDVVVAITDVTQERRIVARAARIPKLHEPESVISADLVRVVAREMADRPFIYAMLRFSEFPETVKHYANGANVLHLNPARISEYRFAIPPASLRHRFGEMVMPLMELSDNLELQNETLTSTRDILLPRLISGQIDVSQLHIDTEGFAA
jgi:type I restriction enzyme S subunit